MSYFPQATDNARTQHANGRPAAPRPVRRAPNDFLDYNHGPDSYGPTPRQPEGRRWSSLGDERQPGQRE